TPSCIGGSGSGCSGPLGTSHSFAHHGPCQRFSAQHNSVALARLKPIHGQGYDWVQTAKLLHPGALMLSATMIADPIDAINEDEVGAPPCGAEGAWGVVSGPGRAKFGGKASPSDANPPNLAPNERSWGTRDQPNCSTFSLCWGGGLDPAGLPESPGSTRA